MWCSSCGAEYRSEFTDCSDCGIALVPDRPEVLEPVGAAFGDTARWQATVDPRSGVPGFGRVRLCSVVQW